MDFLAFFGSSGGIANQAGKEVGQKEDDESEPRVKNGDTDGGAKQPVAITDPLTFGKQIEQEVNPAEDSGGS